VFAPTIKRSMSSQAIARPPGPAAHLAYLPARYPELGTARTSVELWALEAKGLSDGTA
jgi:hypothetical protein